MTTMATETMSIEVGNTHEYTGDGFHNWQLYMTTSAPVVAFVVTSLHPTFSPSRVTLSPKNASGTSFALTPRSGWGVFEICLRVHLKDGYTHRSEDGTEASYIDLRWMLQFDEKDRSQVMVFHLERASIYSDEMESESVVEAEAKADVETSAKPSNIHNADAETDKKLHIHAAEAERQGHEGYRDAVLDALRSRPFLAPKDKHFMHGRLMAGEHTLARPRCVWKSYQPPRDDHDANFATGNGKVKLTASEFQDRKHEMDMKIVKLAKLMHASRKTVLYTGAGISAAVVGQAARSGTNTVGWKGNELHVAPTFTHHALGYLGKVGMVHGWVQQNHDGLPQKAGFPQEKLNEVHGSWYDPSNPVVKYGGSLHDRCYSWMVEDAHTADLVIVLGTSLGGLNADQVATNAAERSCRGEALGTVCINLQQTPQDGKMTLRLFGKTDEILLQLLHELGMTQIACDLKSDPRPMWHPESHVLVPYDAEGRRLKGPSSSPKMWLDLSPGQTVRLCDGHNIQGAQQPSYMHIGATKDIKSRDGRVIRACPGGLGKVLRRDELSCSFQLDIEGASFCLGLWWLDAALRGAVEQLPVVNIHPMYEAE